MGEFYYVWAPSVFLIKGNKDVLTLGCVLILNRVHEALLIKCLI